MLRFVHAGSFPNLVVADSHPVPFLSVDGWEAAESRGYRLLGAKRNARQESVDSNRCLNGRRGRQWVIRETAANSSPGSAVSSLLTDGRCR